MSQYCFSIVSVLFQYCFSIVSVLFQYCFSIVSAVRYSQVKGGEGMQQRDVLRLRGGAQQQRPCPPAQLAPAASPPLHHEARQPVASGRA